jgi:amino acid transporter
MAMVLGGAMVGALFSADSWNNITFIAGEVKNPRRNLPWSLALGVIFVICLYILANLAYLAALPVRSDKLDVLAKTADARASEATVLFSEGSIRRSQASLARSERFLLLAPEQLAKLTAKDDKEGLKKLQQDIARREKLMKVNEDSIAKQKKALLTTKALAVQRNGELTVARGIDHAKDDRVGTAVLERASPGFGVSFMAIAIMISTFGCVNGLILMGARLYYAMAQDRLFFQSVGRLNASGVPAAGLVLQGLWSIVLIFSGTYSDLLDYIIFAALLFYALTVTGLFVLRRTQPKAERPYKALGYPVVPAVYVALCAFIMLDLLVVKPVYSWPSFLIVLAGIPVFWLWRRRPAV